MDRDGEILLEIQLDDTRRWHSRMSELIRTVGLKNELQALLQRAHPELVQYVRGYVSQWVLRLIK